MENSGCVICGKAKRFAKASTCSRECSNLVKRKKLYEKRECPVCSKEFEERTKRERRFCSDLCRAEWSARPENIIERLKRGREGVKKKYGVDSVFKLADVQKRAHDNMLKTHKERGGQITQQIKATKLERYGDENYNNMSKNRDTKLMNHGNEHYNNREKAVRTMMNEYGVSYAIQREDFQAKQRATNAKRYGAEHPFQNKEIMDEMKRVIQERYGVQNISQSMENKLKVTKAWKENLVNQKQYVLYSTLLDNDLEILGEFTGVNNLSYDQEVSKLKEYLFRCLKCAHEFTRTYANWELPICRRCHPVNTNPSTHDLIRNYLQRRGVDFTENDRRFLGDRREVDFNIPQYKLCIEVDGNLFHSEIFGGKEKDYHLSKTIDALRKGSRLIHVFEDELRHPEIILSRIAMMIMDPSIKKVGSRECEVRMVDKSVKRSFYEANHIQGTAVSVHDVGLWRGDELLSLMSFSVKRSALGNTDVEQGAFELIRFCNKTGYNVQGAFSRLLSSFIRAQRPAAITTYADIRWSGYDPSTTVYAKNGFHFDGYSPPNYWYFKRGDYLNRHHRFQYRKNVLVDMAVDGGLVNDPEQAKLFTEWGLAQLLGMDRIWDCGSMRFVWLAKPV